VVIGRDAEAEGDDSIVIGTSNNNTGASSKYAISLGYLMTCSDRETVAIGYLTAASNPNSMIFGSYNDSDFDGETFSISPGRASVAGDSKHSIVMLRKDSTASASQVTLNTTGANQSNGQAASKEILLSTNAVYLFDVDIVGKGTGTGGTYDTVENIKFAVGSNGNVGTITTTTYLGTTASPTATYSAGTLSIKTNGDAGAAKRWTATAKITKVKY